MQLLHKLVLTLLFCTLVQAESEYLKVTMCGRLDSTNFKCFEGERSYNNFIRFLNDYPSLRNEYRFMMMEIISGPSPMTALGEAEPTTEALVFSDTTMFTLAGCINEGDNSYACADPNKEMKVEDFDSDQSMFTGVGFFEFVDVLVYLMEEMEFKSILMTSN